MPGRRCGHRRPVTPATDRHIPPAALLLGASATLRTQVGGVLLSSATYALYAGITAVQVRLGFVDPTAAVLLMGTALLMNLAFYAAVRSGRVAHGADPGLARTQLIVGVLFMFAGYALSGRSAAAVPIVMASHIVYAMFTMPPALVWRLVIASLAGLAATMLVCHRLWPAQYEPAMQIVSFLYAALVVPLIALLAHRLARLTQRLRDQQRDLQSALDRLEALATQDELTQLHNRRHMSTLMQRHRQDPEHRATAVALLDIDFFKRVNDRHGHAAGDAVLRHFARLAQQCLRGEDVIARWGGEEFLLLLPGSTTEQAVLVLERVRQQVTSTPLDDVAPGLRIDFSAGVAALESGQTLEQVVERADRAMYRAKTAGRGRTEIDAPA